MAESLDAQKKKAEIRKLEAEAVYWERAADEKGRELEESYLSDTESRRVFFYSDVNENAVADCIDELNLISRKSPKKEITVVINSPGGYCVDGLALYDHLMGLRKKGHRIITEASGHVASMGGILLQAGTVRRMQPNAYLLIHEVSAGAIGKTSHLKDKAEWAEELTRRLYAILAERASYTVAQIKKKADRRDWILWAEDAVDAGFADEVTL